MNYTNDQLINLARNNPKELARTLTNSNTNVSALSFGIEILGEEVKDELIVLPVFHTLLKHINAVVRESACIGVVAFYGNKVPPKDLLDKLQSMSLNDPSPMIKNYILNILQDFPV